jgi:hypothetical protein
MKGPKMDRGLKTSNSNRQEFVEAIDNLFLKLELSYHYQFYKVFGTDQRLSEAKRLWAESLKKYPAASINSAAEMVIQTNDYLPTLTEVIKACGDSLEYMNIPSVQEAFIESQKSSSPRQEFPWTAPIIYWAAREVGWDIINSSNNSYALKVFSKVYLRLAKEMSAGKSFHIHPRADREILEPIDLDLLASLRKKHGI